MAYYYVKNGGTAVGDATELSTLLGALGDADEVPEPRPVLGSVKALIGHTKAAAGAAGLFPKDRRGLHRAIRETVPRLRRCRRDCKIDRRRTPDHRFLRPL